jgi:hypothetical protein
MYLPVPTKPQVLDYIELSDDDQGQYGLFLLNAGLQDFS